MSIRIISISQHVLPMRTRMPFRYGIVTATEMLHLFVKVDAEIDGRRQVGFAADHLAIKWFTKNPATSIDEDTRELLAVIDQACTIAKAIPKVPTVFAFWKYLYEMQGAWGGGWGKPPLLSHFGTSLVERAVIDAFCKARSVPFWKAVRHNTLGVDLEVVQPELAGTEPKDWLPAEPLRQVIARHTIGLIDPLTDADIAPGDRIDDGLPQSLEACIAAYGLTHFKIKLSGDAKKDIDRVRAIADVLRRSVPAGDYRFTLDANENFRDVEPFRAFWTTLTDDATLTDFLRRLIFIEQPLHRDVATSADVGKQLAAWPDRPPMIIDESDGAIETARLALDRGYIGTSHKNCKGVIKGLANACLIARRRSIDPAGRYTISGEDLANVGPVALMQDLAVVSALGIGDVERNGHHYFRGLSVIPGELQQRVVAGHPDLYAMRPEGYAALRLSNGRLNVGSVVDAPFGTAFDFNPDMFDDVSRHSARA